MRMLICSFILLGLPPCSQVLNFFAFLRSRDLHRRPGAEIPSPKNGICGSTEAPSLCNLAAKMLGELPSELPVHLVIFVSSE